MSPWKQSLTDYLDLYDEYAQVRYSHLKEEAFLLKEYTPLLADAIWAFALALNRSEGSQKQRKDAPLVHATLIDAHRMNA